MDSTKISNPFLTATTTNDDNNGSSGGGFLERWRNLYCNVSNRGCKYAWYFSLLGGLYLYIHFSCTSLIFRLLMQLAMIVATWMAIARFYAAYILYKQLTTKNQNDLIKSCIVLSTKLVPEKPIPNFPQRCIATIRFLDDDNNEQQLREQQQKNDDNSSSSDDDNDPLVVLTDPKDNIQIDDQLMVTLLEGDRSRVVYIPYLRQSMKRMIWAGIQNVIIVLVAYVMLAYVIMPGIPIAFASSESIEMDIRSSWWCTVELNEEDDDETKNEKLEDCCHITPAVTWAYNSFIGINLIGALFIFFYFRSIVKDAKEKKKKEAMKEEGGEEENHNNNNNNNDHYSAVELT